MSELITSILQKIRVQGTTGIKAFVLKYLRMFLLVLKGFQEDECSLWASALTLYSLLSVVPVLALAFGIAKGFGFEKMLEDQLLEGILMALSRNWNREELVNYVRGHTWEAVAQKVEGVLRRTLNDRKRD